jgi:hypothetical protein
MDEMEANNRHRIQKEMDLDRGIACMRIALLDEKAGNVSEAKDYIRKAQESLKKRGGTDISEDNLRDLVAKFDSTPTYKLPGVFLLNRGMWADGGWDRLLTFPGVAQLSRPSKVGFLKFVFMRSESKP